MISWSNIFYFSLISAALLLSVLRLWFTAIIPGIGVLNHFSLVNIYKN